MSNTIENSSTDGSRTRMLPTPPHTTAVNPASPLGGVPTPPRGGVMGLPTPNEVKSEGDIDEELLLKWDDHHRSFFLLAEELCHQDIFVDVTLSCGNHNFPAHKLILSVCSPYFRHLFLRNPCKHPIVVLKDVHFKYMKLLLMYMYRGEVSCPQEDLPGLLRTARSLQVRGLIELECRREAEGLTSGVSDSSIRRTVSSDIIEGGSASSCDIDNGSRMEEFSLDDVRTRLHGQLEIQPISQPSSTFHPNQPYLQPLPSQYHHWREGNDQDSHQSKQAPSSSSEFVNDVPSQGNGGHNHRYHQDDSDRMPHYQKVRRMDEVLYGKQKQVIDNGGGNNGTDLTAHSRRSPHGYSSAVAAAAVAQAAAATTRHPKSRSKSVANHAAQLLAAAQAAGMPAESLDPSNPMSSVNALLAAAQAQTSSSTMPTSTLSSLLPSATVASSSTNSPSPHSNSTPPAASAVASSSNVPSANAASSSSRDNGTNGTGASNSNNGSNTNGQPGVDLSQAAAVANLQLYYYMQKVASAGMGNPKERKECPICSKTLYDRSTWNRHMRIHTGEKPYPCQFCGRRFRTNYNKIGHEKKCPDRQNRAMLQNAERLQQQQQQETPPAAASSGASSTSAQPSNNVSSQEASDSQRTTSTSSPNNQQRTEGVVYR